MATRNETPGGTIYLPMYLLKELDKIKEKGSYPSRSWVARILLEEAIQKMEARREKS